MNFIIETNTPHSLTICSAEFRKFRTPKITDSFTYRLHPELAFDRYSEGVLILTNVLQGFMKTEEQFLRKVQREKSSLLEYIQTLSVSNFITVEGLRQFRRLFTDTEFSTEYETIRFIELQLTLHTMIDPVVLDAIRARTIFALIVNSPHFHREITTFKYLKDNHKRHVSATLINTPLTNFIKDFHWFWLVCACHTTQQLESFGFRAE